MEQGNTRFNAHLRKWYTKGCQFPVDYSREYYKCDMLYTQLSDQLRGILRLMPWKSMSYDEITTLLSKLDSGRQMQGFP